jgi:hypothetical protein
VNDDLFENLAHLEHLEQFSFGGNKMSGVALPMLKLLPSLRSLSVSGRQRTDSGLWSVSVTDFNVSHIAGLDQLEVLDLGETSVTDRGIAELARLSNLHTLDLSGTRVTRKGVAALSGLSKVRHLKLDLLAMQNLQILELQETSVTAEGLMQLGQKASLQQLMIGGISVPPEQLDAIRSALPGCAVIWWEKPKITSSGPKGRHLKAGGASHRFAATNSRAFGPKGRHNRRRSGQVSALRALYLGGAPPTGG